MNYHQQSCKLLSVLNRKWLIKTLNKRGPQIDPFKCCIQGTFRASIPVLVPKKWTQKFEQYSTQKFIFYQADNKLAKGKLGDFVKKHATAT